MSWLDFLLRRRIETELIEAAQTIAVRRRVAVWERVANTVMDMSTSEARGYVRARSATIVHSEVEKVIACHDLITDSHRQPLLMLATDAVIADILVQRNRRRAAAATISRAA